MGCFSDLDIDIPSKKSEIIKQKLIKSSIIDKSIKKHPVGVYLYKKVPHYMGWCVIDYKEMEHNNYQKIDILNNTFLDDLTNTQMTEALKLIEKENIDWLQLHDEPHNYQLDNYPSILKQFNVRSVLDVAIVLAIIRPGAIQYYNKLKSRMNSDLNRFNDIDAYGLPIFSGDGLTTKKYRYKKSHAIGYAYILLIDFLKKTKKI